MKHHRKAGMKQLFTLLVALGLGTTALQAQTAEEGLRATELMKYEQAKAIFKKLIAGGGKASNYFHLGNIYLINQKNDSASYFFEQGITKDANEPLNYVGRGRVQLYDKKYNDGKASFNKAIELTKNKDANTLQYIAASFWMVYIPEESGYAREKINRAMELDPKNARHIVVSGDIHRLNGEGGQGATEYRRAMATDPKLAMAPLRLADFYTKLGNLEEAKTFYDQVIAIDPNYAPVYKQLGEYWYKKNDINQAISSYEKFLSMVGTSPDERIRYAAFLFQAKKYNESIDQLKIALGAEPNNTVALRLMGYAQFEAGQTADGLATMQKFFSLAKPTEIYATDYAYMGRLYSANKQDSLAVINYRTALEKDTAATDMYELIAKTYEKMGKYSDAAKYMEMKMASDARKGKLNQVDYFTLGTLYFQDKQYVKADTAFATFTRAVPAYVPGYLYRALVHRALDPKYETGEATPYFNTFIEKANASGDPAKYKSFMADAYVYMGSVEYTKANKSTAKIKNYDAAEAQFKKALENDPNNATAKKMMDYFEKYRAQAKKMQAQPKK